MNSDLKKALEKAFDATNISSNFNDKILIVDGLNYFIRIFSAVPALNDNGDHVGGVIGFLKSLAYTIRLINPTRCIIIFDGKGGSQKRKKLYKEYKANRVNKTAFNRFGEFVDVEAEQQSMQIQITRLVGYLKCLPVSILSIDNIEADDAIAYITTKLASNEVVITSTDKDFYQLITDKVSVYRPTKKTFYDFKILFDEYGIHPSNFILARLFTGDASDNITGIDGIGFKSLIKHFPILVDTPTNLDEIFEISKMKISDNSKFKIFKLILDSEEILRRNFELMQLNDVEISGNTKAVLRATFDEMPTKVNPVNFIKMMSQDRMNTNMKDPLAWLHNSFNRLNQFAI